jgi:hypothetical protein
MTEPSKRGQNGGNARKEKLSPERRKEIAKEAAKKRWSKKDNPQPVDGALHEDGIHAENMGLEPTVYPTYGGIERGSMPMNEPNITPPVAAQVPHGPQPPQENHCPACLNGQSLENGEGTHILATVEHPVAVPAVIQDAEAIVASPAPPTPPVKPSKRQAKPKPKAFKDASSYAEKRLPQAIKEKSDHVGAVARLDAEINDLVRVIKALGGTVDQQTGPQLSYPTPSYAPPQQALLDDPYPNMPAIDPALYQANKGPIPAMSGPIAPPELVPGMPTGGAEDLDYAPGADVRWV